ncbi:MAG: hypothetical protein F7C08_02015 [Desulfurococcales archaeon]|nr:hypothetical protein [Desulfurococcales archaeon]
MRNTLSWIRCSLCGRRMPTNKCIVDGVAMDLCPYCITALSVPGGPCSRGSRGKGRRKLELDEELLTKLGG